MNQGHEDADGLWEIGKRLNESKAQTARLALLIASQQHKVAWYAGSEESILLSYLQGETELAAP